MVNVQLFSGFLLSDSAMLAAVVISLAGYGSLRLPIEAIVWKSPASPSGMRRTNMIIRSPLARTFLVAELLFVISYSIGLALYLITTGSARNLNTGIVESIFAFGFVCLLPFVVTAIGAKVHLRCEGGSALFLCKIRPALSTSKNTNRWVKAHVFEVARMRTKRFLASPCYMLGTLKFNAASIAHLLFAPTGVIAHKGTINSIVTRVRLKGLLAYWAYLFYLLGFVRAKTQARTKTTRPLLIDVFLLARFALVGKQSKTSCW